MRKIIDYMSPALLAGQWQLKDFRDQPLHFLMGSWPVFLAWYLSHSHFVCFAFTAFNIYYLARREFNQHKESQHFINLDLVVGVSGCIISNVVTFFI